jgi:hypothetical protein
MVTVLVGTSAHAQTNQSMALQELNAARQLLNSLPASTSAETTRRITDFKADFNDLYRTYAALGDGTGASDTGTEPFGGSWRLKLGIVNSDLRSVDGLETPIQTRLGEIHAHLDAFYNRAIGVPDAATPTSPASGATSTGTLTQLDRAQMLVDELVMTGGSGDRGPQVTVNRATLVQLQMIIAQVRAAARSGTAPLR